MQNQNNGFSLIGKWKNVTTTNTQPSIELFFYDYMNVTIRLNPGGEFENDYYIEKKPDYSILRFANKETGEIGLSVFLFKIVDESTLQVQVVDKYDAPEWDNNAEEINVGFLKREKD